MPAKSIVRWDPSRLNSSLSSGFRRSVIVAGADAKAHAPSRKAGARSFVRGNVGYIVPTGLGAVFEQGADPHEIKPRRRSAHGFLAGGLSHPIRGPIAHPGAAAKPYMGPAGERWAHGGCQAVMRQSMIAGGFR